MRNPLNSCYFTNISCIWTLGFSRSQALKLYLIFQFCWFILGSEHNTHCQTAQRQLLEYYSLLQSISPRFINTSTASIFGSEKFLITWIRCSFWFVIVLRCLSAYPAADLFASALNTHSRPYRRVLKRSGIPWPGPGGERALGCASEDA